MGDKVSAKNAMKKAGLPTVPGYDAALPDAMDEVLKIARGIGYPVIVKAAGGGGGVIFNFTNVVFFAGPVKISGSSIAALSGCSRRSSGESLLAFRAFELMPRIGIAFVLKHCAGTREPMNSVHPWYVMIELASQLESGLNDTMLALLEQTSRNVEPNVTAQSRRRVVQRKA